MSRVAVIGAGAMGGLWAARLGLAGHDVTVVDPSTEVIESVRAEGLRLLEPDGEGISRPEAANRLSQ